VTEDLFDLIVIGGGINGCGIARDAAGRGLKVLLVEQNDLASGTSSASSKLIHGGLRYLEQYEFRLVREALAEREVLLKAAPHIIHPLRFVLPHAEHLRPAWMIRLGLFLYDHLGGRKILPASRSVNLLLDAVGKPLKEAYYRGFTYSDCWVDDARLVVLNALDAAAHGAEILTRAKCTSARRRGPLWHVDIAIKGDDRPRKARTRALVNAAGPWVETVLNDTLKLKAAHHLRLVKGSHIIVPQLYAGDQAYILQNPDGRVVFVIPFEGQYSLIGTTDVDFTGDPVDAAITDAEIDYLCASVNGYFRKTLTPSQVIYRYAGVRPLYGEDAAKPSEVSRDYVLEIDADPEGSVLLNVFSGKITTHRRLAEAALLKLSPWLPAPGKPWTHDAFLPGGDIGGVNLDRFITKMSTRYPWIDSALITRYACAYGTKMEDFLKGARRIDDLGPEIGDGLYEAELRYLVSREWARSAQDILWRRSKLGLHVSPRTLVKLEAWMAAEDSMGNRPNIRGF
jgi:glycerol-3-phosphate dehydrogenase